MTTGSTRVSDDALTRGLRHAAYGCWLTSVRASGAATDARDVHLLAAEAAGVVDEVRSYARSQAQRSTGHHCTKPCRHWRPRRQKPTSLRTQRWHVGTERARP